uniref:Uncharacterized protein n=1 Tax=Arundo donax TaxID=35708 RepID=A0A0A8Y8I8_ARUDO
MRRLKMKMSRHWVVSETVIQCCSKFVTYWVFNTDKLKSQCTEAVFNQLNTRSQQLDSRVLIQI